MTARHPRRRGGFTLIEMLVAMGIAILLLGIIVAVTQSGFMGSFRTVRAADRVSQWLVTAKNRAARDGVPRGLRFYVNAQGHIGEAQYIEMPPTWAPIQSPSDAGSRIVFTYTIDAMNNIAQPQHCYYINDAANYTAFDALGILRGDTLMISDFGSGFTLSDPPTAASITWAGSPKAAREIPLYPGAYPNLGAGFADASGKAMFATPLFGFQTQPKPMFGDPPLIIGQDLAIEAAMCKPMPQPNQSLDVIFSPNGQVLAILIEGTPAPLNAFAAFWVRDISFVVPPTEFANAGEQVLVVVYPKTGAISTQQVKPVAGQEYDFAKDGINTGL